ncbi:disease resistance response protein [Trifolium pratense]|uniref:Dirigent protein n=1 Tax=Trifolium pratense TaxID=57577 RepID=A0A2K3P550_TRIPR|nr:disease resistance response protein [Trifolium pratense]
MANVFLHNANTWKTTLCLLLLTTTFLIANSARNLDEVDSQPQAIGNLPGPGAGAAIPSGTTIPQINPITASPIVQTPAATTTTNNVTPASGLEDTHVDPLVSENEAPAQDVPPVGSPTTDETPEELPQPEAEVPLPPPEVPLPAVSNVTPVSAKPVGKEPSLSFFMHDILGGSHPSARVVAGIVANTDVTGLPFSKLNNNLFPITGGIPLVNPKLNGIVTNNNLPNLVGLSAAQSSTVFKNSGTSNTVSGGNNQPFVSAGNLPGGFTIQKLMFGSVTVIDDQLTEEHELDSSVIGRAQGFYLASSLDGTSKTVVLTVLVHGGEHHDGVDDTISLFGIHRTASPESEIAVIGGTGKYENARGYASLETLLKEDEHTTDGADTILHFSIYLTE